MKKDLIEFNKNITKLTKEIATLREDNGTISLFNIGQLMCGCEYLQLDKMQFEKAKFEMIVDKNEEYNTIETIRKIDKYTNTKNKRDKGTIIDEKVEVKEVWIVKNSLGLTHSFNKKENAVKYTDEMNNKYLEMAELI